MLTTTKAAAASSNAKAARAPHQLKLPTPANSFCLDEDTSLSTLLNNAGEACTLRQYSADGPHRKLSQPSVLSPADSFAGISSPTLASENASLVRDSCALRLDPAALSVVVPTPLQSPLEDLATSPVSDRHDSDTPVMMQAPTPRRLCTAARSMYEDEHWNSDSVAAPRPARATASMPAKYFFEQEVTQPCHGAPVADVIPTSSISPRRDCPRASPTLTNLHVIDMDVDDDLDADGCVLGLPHPLEPTGLGPQRIQPHSVELRWF
jgi:hypothetical protein